MAAYGSRREKFAPIFKRVQSLIKNGALVYENRPLWFDIYKRFPPKVEPNHARPIPTDEVREIFYREDLDRAEIFRRFSNLGVINGFKSTDDRSRISMVMRKCVQVRDKQPDLTTEDFFSAVHNELQRDGFPTHKKEDM